MVPFLTEVGNEMLSLRLIFWKTYTTFPENEIDFLKVHEISFQMVYEMWLGTGGELNSLNKALFGVSPLA